MLPFRSADRVGLLASCLCLLLIATVGCSGPRLIEGEGVISAAQADQGIYALTGADSVVYHPLNLPARYREDGTAVSFAATLRPEAILEGMSGIPVELHRILPLRVQGPFTVHRADTLGVAYGLVDAEGRRFQPIQPLEGDYAVDSLPVTADLHIRPAAPAGSTTWGTPAEVREIAYADTTLRRGVARVVYQNLEGGFYGLVDLEGNRWRPMVGLPEGFRVDGARVRLLYRPAEPELSMHMWGSPIEIVSVRPLE